jgi:Flp pilus assembly protein TadG
VLQLACVTFIGILFLGALAIDGGSMLAARRQAQNCADAGALAGAIEIATVLGQGGTPTANQVSTAVTNALTANKYTGGTGGNCTVTVNWPPQTGNFQDNNSVEVLLNFKYKNLVVSGQDSITVRSVASTDTGGANSFPMLVTDPTASNAFWVNSGALTLNAAPIQVNSTSATSAVVNGMAGSKANATVSTVGGTSGSFSTPPTTGAAPVANPYALLQAPSTTGLSTINQSNFLPDASGKITLNPGYYPNGLYVINGGNVTMNPGMYYIANGNFWINTTGTVTGNQVTIYHDGPNNSALLNKDFDLNVGICLCPTDGNYTFTPPTSGQYAGVSFFHGPNNTATAFYDFWGSGTLTVGLQYFPDSTLRTWSATHGGQINCNEVVTKDWKLVGYHEIYGNNFNGGFSKVNWTASRAANRPPTNVYLAE